MWTPAGSDSEQQEVTIWAYSEPSLFSTKTSLYVLLMGVFKILIQHIVTLQNNRRNSPIYLEYSVYFHAK